MSTPDFTPGCEIQDSEGNVYQVIREINDYSVRVWDFQNSCETLVEKRFFATY